MLLLLPTAKINVARPPDCFLLDPSHGYTVSHSLQLFSSTATHLILQQTLTTNKDLKKTPFPTSIPFRKSLPLHLTLQSTPL